MTATTTATKSTEFHRPSAGQVRAPAGVTRHVTGPVLVTGTDVDAISMPAAFGALVLAELEIMMLAGPVTADDDGSRTFLTQRAGGPRHAVPADLLPLGVRAVPAGAAVPAPDPDTGRAPEDWWTVIGAARRVAHRVAHRARRDA